MLNRITHSNLSQTRPQHRLGAAALEATAMIGAWTVLFVGIFDFGSATINRNLVSHVARQATRLAIVRGSAAAPELPVWGPATQTFKLSDNHPIANTLRPIAGGSATNNYTVTIQWIDGGNDAEQRVLRNRNRQLLLRTQLRPR